MAGGGTPPLLISQFQSISTNLVSASELVSKKRKSTRKDKELRRLRREVELMRAQLSNKPVGADPRVGPSPGRRQPQPKTTPTQLKKDLRKTAVISLICLAAILGASFFLS